MLISVSILSIKEKKKLHVRELNKTKADYLHLDIMDGILVPDTSEDFTHYKHLVNISNHPLDIHLMVKDVISYVDSYSQLKPTYITFHFEATDNPLTMIDYIKNKNIKVGISIKPETPVSVIKEYLSNIDLVLVMTVEPGFGGQTFMADAASKIKELKHLKEENNYNYVIEVDGGINDKTSIMCQNADILVIGSFITNSDNYNRQIDIIKQALKP